MSRGELPVPWVRPDIDIALKGRKRADEGREKGCEIFKRTDRERKRERNELRNIIQWVFRIARIVEREGFALFDHEK